MMLYKNMKVMVCSLNGDADLFKIFPGVLRRDTFLLYWLIICLDCILRTSIDLIKENGFTLRIKEADKTLQKLWQMQTMQMISCFSQIYLSQPNLYCIALSKQQEVLTFIWTQIKLNSCVLNKLETSLY